MFFYYSALLSGCHVIHVCYHREGQFPVVNQYNYGQPGP